jgi:hypothetical protein
MSRKIVLAVVLILAVLLIVLSFSLNTVIGKNRGRIQEDLERALGRAVHFSELKVSFWDGPGIVATDVKVAEDPSFAATPFLQAKELRMRLRWLPLLIGRLRIERFVLEQPEIQIIKNEAGQLNIAVLAAREKKTPAADSAGEPAKQRKPAAAPRLVISDIRVRDGSLDYIDRTGRETIEVRVRRLDLSASGALNGPAEVKVAAQLFNASGHNVAVEGKVGPLASRPWSQAPLDVKIRCDSLPLEPLIRAVPALRPYLFDYLQAGGPITFDSRLQGTIERPRFLGLSLTGAFFGSGATNTTLKGDIDLSRGEQRENSALKLKLTIDPLPLDQVKSFSFLQPLRASLLLEGSMGISADIEGSLDALKVRAAVKAADSEIVYGSWFKKPKGLPTDLALDIERQKDRILVRDSTLALNNAKVKFSGALEDLPERRLLLTVSGDDFGFTNLEKLTIPLSGYNLGGSLSARLALAKNLDASGDLDVRGTVTFDKLQVKERRSSRGIEHASGQIVFRGREARIDRLLLRSGASDVAIAAVADLSQPALRYSLRAVKLKPNDFLSSPFSKGDEMKSVGSTGDLVWKDGKPSLRASVASAEGILTELPYRNLRGEIFWSPAALGLKNVSFQTLNGNVRAAASWDTAAENSLRMAIEPNIESIELKTFLKRKDAFRSRGNSAPRRKASPPCRRA